MSDLSLGALSMQLKVDAEGLDASIKKAIGGLDKIESAAISTAQKTEDVGKVMKRALAGEVLVNAMNRVSSSLTQLGGEYKGLGEAVQGAGAIMQGLFQGGVIGAGVAAASVGVSALTQMWGEAEKAAKAAEDASMKAFTAHLDRMKALNDQIAEVSTQVRGAILAAKGGTDAASGVRAISAGDAAKREGQLAIERMDVGAQFGSANARLEKLKAAPTYAPGFQAQQIAEQQAVVDGLLARMRELDQQLDEAAGASNLIAAQEVLAETTKKAAKQMAAAKKPLTDFEQMMKDLARSDAAKFAEDQKKLLEKANASAMNLGAMRNPDGSIASEARDRAARNAGYRANAGETVFGDGDRERSSKESEAARKRMASGDDVKEMNEILQQMVDDVEELTFAEQLGIAMNNIVTGFKAAGETLAQSLSSLAPKTASAIDAAMKGFQSGGWSGAIAGALSSAVSQSIEFQAVGKALDSGLVEIINAISEVLRPAVPVITMAIRAVVEAAKVVMGIVDIVASALQLDTVFAIVFEVVKVLAAVLSVGAFAIKYALDGMQNALKNFMIWLLSLPIFLGAFTQQVEDMKKSLVVQGDFVAGASKAWNDVMKIGFNAEIAAVGMADAAAAADKVAASFLNLPAGFKTAAAIYGATSASGAPFGGFAPPSVSPGMPGVAPSVSGASSPSGGGDVLNFYGPINIEGDEGLKVGAKRAARQRGMSGNGTTGGREAEPGAWDGVWDLTP